MTKYKVYADYRFTIEIGEYEADTEEKAIEKGSENVDSCFSLCYQCEEDMLDHPILDDDSFSAELVKGES